MKNKLDPIGVLSESIIKYIKESLASASFDKTQKGIITETLSDNRYKVKIAQTTYTVPAVIAGSYAVGDEVYVIIPQNDPDQMFLLPVGISELDPSTTVLSVNGKTGYVSLGIPDIPNLSTELNSRVSKETGKGLSTNDYTTAEKQKLAGISQNANNYIHPASHPASMVVFSDGDTFQQKLDQGELKGDKGDSFKVGESYETATEKTFFFKLMS